MLKIPLEFFWNIQNFVLSSKQSVCNKNSMFCGLFNFDQNRCIRTLPAWPFCWLIFFVEFFKCWKYPSNSSETLKMLLLSSKESVWSKNSMFCGIFNFHQNCCIRTLPAWPFFWLIFFVEFFKCWKYPSNSSETFKILFFHQNNQFEAKTAFFADFSILTKIAVSGHYRCGHFVNFFWLSFFKCWKYPSNSSETFKILFFHQNNQFASKKSMFCGLFNFDENCCIRTLPAWPFCWQIYYRWFFEMLKIPFQFFWNIQNIVAFIKTTSLKQKRHVLRTFQFWPKSLYPDITGVAILLVDFFGWFFWLIFWNVENTLRILLKHSKFGSFIKTISLKQKQHVLRTFEFWPKSLYPDLIGVAIFLVDFLKC